MKLLKKIGLIAIILVVCLTSTIQKVNAYTVQANNILNADETYYLYLSQDFDWDGALFGYIHYQNQTYELITESYSTIFVSGDYDDFEWVLKYEGNYMLSDYTIYEVYSFTPNISCELIDYNYSRNQCFIETNLISNDTGIYNSIYSLIERYLFGGIINPNSVQELTATLLSGTICILVFALPFLIVWKVIKIVVG